MADEQREGWKELYQTAMLETDVEKFRTRVGEAIKAIIERLRELGRGRDGDVAERQALADALLDLRVLSRDGSGNP